MIKVNELFSGIGAFRKALENLNISHEIVGISEIDKYAIKSYEAIYGETKNYGDISKVEKLDYADLWTYGFPCQDISVAGKGAGIVKGKTRSGLLYEVERLLLESQKANELPKYLIMENVKNLVGKHFITDFERWLEFLKYLGYMNYWEVLDAKDYGIPQHRERVFCVSILGKQKFEFPEKQPLTLKLNDLLEEKVDEKFYLSQDQITKICFSTFNSQVSRIQDKNYCDTLCARDYKGPLCIKQIRKYSTPKRENSRFRVFDTNGISPTICSEQGGNTQPHIKENVRRLIPKEYWRLMGFDDASFEKAEKVCSNTRLYKQAGNSIVVNVVESILKNLQLHEIKTPKSIVSIKYSERRYSNSKGQA